MDEKTVRIHHDKHHAAYVAGANCRGKLREIADGKLDASATTNWYAPCPSTFPPCPPYHFLDQQTPDPEGPQGPLMDAIRKNRPLTA
ncbi:MAG: hypothetical protein ACLSUW_00235 [Akkermansia sp.]